MELVGTPGQMAKFMTGSGKMANIMEKANLRIKRELPRLGFGIMERGCIGLMNKLASLSRVRPLESVKL